MHLDRLFLSGKSKRRAGSGNLSLERVRPEFHAKVFEIGFEGLEARPMRLTFSAIAVSD
jgi:hypothetical protein